MQEPRDHYYPSQGGDSDVHDRRQDLEREESTTSYPIIGEGYSDTISIVSDITTPTVMPGQEIPIDEYDNGPPLQIGFSVTTKPKKKLRRPSLESPAGEPQNEINNSMKPSIPEPPLPPPAAPTISKSGGAAAKRRQNYQLAMAQLEASSGARLLVGGRGGTAAPAAGSASRTTTLRDSKGTDLVGQRSLLRKSSDYAASVSVTAESLRKMSLVKEALSTNETPGTRQQSAMASATTTTAATPGTRAGESMTAVNDGFGGLNTSPHNFGFPKMNAVGDSQKNQTVDSSGFSLSGDGFNFLSNTTNNKNSGGNDGTILFGDSCLFDDDGFPMSTTGSTIQDPFAISSAFGTDFTQSFSSNDSGDLEDAFTPSGPDNFFHLAPPSKDSAKKKKGRRSSIGGSGGTSSGKSSSHKSKKKDDAKTNTDDKASGSSSSSRKKSGGDETVHHESGGQRQSSVGSGSGKKRG